MSTQGTEKRVRVWARVSNSLFFSHSRTDTHTKISISLLIVSQLLFSIYYSLNPCAMFDFCKLDVYQKAKAFCILITKAISSENFDRTTNDQLRRASFSIKLNIAEGSSRFSNKDRKNFMIVAWGSAFECAAILEYLYEVSEIDKESYVNYLKNLEEISKMLFGLIRGLDK